MTRACQVAPPSARGTDADATDTHPPPKPKNPRIDVEVYLTSDKMVIGGTKARTMPPKLVPVWRPSTKGRT